nr:putative integron gene cassette protein [uncultured bacterium]
MMSRFDFWNRWLLVVGWVLVAFGLIFAVLSQTWLYELAFNRHIDPVFWPEKPIPPSAEQFQAWIYGVLGATVAGWGVFVVFLARHPLRRRERWAWNCLFIGITAWFAVDTAISAFYGVFFNVLFNCGLAVSVYLPLVATRKEFR